MLGRIPRSLLLLTLAHALVDAYASLIQPLWPDFQTSLALDDASTQGLFVLWTLATSMSQLAFGFWGDRLRGRWLLWCGTTVGVVGMSVLGLATTLPSLGSLLLISGLGIAAFHPEAATLAGASAPQERARAMSLFSVGGYLGQAAGPIISGVVTTRYGLPALSWGVFIGLALVGWLALSLFRAEPAESRIQVAPCVALGPLLRRRIRPITLMMLIGVLRVMPAAGLPLALAFLLKARGASNAEVGIAQSAFVAAIGAGSLICAMFVRGARERRILTGLPLLALPCLLVVPWVGYWGLVISVSVVGALLGVVMPILIGYGQQLLPEAQRIASSMTMGVTWALGGVLVAGLVAACNHIGRPAWTFPAFAVGVLLSSLLCLRLPSALSPTPA